MTFSWKWRVARGPSFWRIATEVSSLEASAEAVLLSDYAQSGAHQEVSIASVSRDGRVGMDSKRLPKPDVKDAHFHLAEFSMRLLGYTILNPRIPCTIILHGQA